MLKTHTLSTSEKRRYSPRGRAVRRIPLRLRLKTELSFFIDIVDDPKEAALIRRLQQEEWEAALQWEREHGSIWWD